MSARAKSERWELLWVSGLTLGTIGALVFFLQQELKPRRLGAQDRTPVAKLQYSAREVQRKFDRDVIWEKAPKDIVLFSKDSVRTAGKSAARIIFDDGTQLDLAENSLVILDRSNEKVKIDFLKGSVFARGVKGGGGGQNLEITTKTGKIELASGDKSGEVSLYNGQSGLEVTVAQGSAKIQTDKGVAELSANERGNMNDGGLSRQKLKFVLNQPDQNAKFVATGATAPIEFDWDGEKDLVPVAKLQIATDPEFRHLVGTSKVGGKREKLHLAEGTYYWRVMANTAGADGKATKEMSDRRVLLVMKHPAVVLETPAPKAEIAFFNQKPNVSLQWRAGTNQREGTSIVQMSQESDFSDNISLPKAQSLDATSGAGRAVYNELAPGTYYWRVATKYEGIGPHHADSITVPSTSRTFEVVKLGKLPSPGLLKPLAGASITYDKNNPKVAFSWSPVAEATGYRIKIAKDPQFDSVVVEQPISTGNQWEGDVQQIGNLYWTVEATLDKLSSAPAKARSFMAMRSGGFNLVAPKLAETFKYLKERPTVNFEWEALAGVKRYEVQVSGTQGFETILFKKQVKDTKAELDELPIGVKYWRVATFGDKDTVTSYSEVRSYRIEQEAPLTAPEKMMPDPHRKVELTPDQSDVEMKFQWKPMEKAKAYKLSVWRVTPAGRLDVVFSKETKATDYAKDLGPGNYQWDVRSVDEINREGPSGSIRTFDLTNAYRLAAPTIISPLARTHFEDAKPKALDFKWNPVAGADKYDVSVYKMDPLQPSNSKLVFKKEVSDSKISVDAIKRSGNYKLQILPKGKLKGEVSTSEFSVKWLDVLGAPLKVRMRMEEDRIPAGQ